MLKHSFQNNVCLYLSLCIYRSLVFAKGFHNFDFIVNAFDTRCTLYCVIHSEKLAIKYLKVAKKMWKQLKNYTHFLRSYKEYTHKLCISKPSMNILITEIHHTNWPDFVKYIFLRELWSAKIIKIKSQFCSLLELLSANAIMC